MSEYTPTTDAMRNSWIDYMTTEGDWWDGLPEEEAQALWDRWLAARDREVAAKALRDAAERVQRALPGLLIEDADSDDGWLSDAQNAQVMADHYAVSFCGEGSIDVHQIASIAAVLIEKGADDGEH